MLYAIFIIIIKFVLSSHLETDSQLSLHNNLTKSKYSKDTTMTVHLLSLAVAPTRMSNEKYAIDYALYC
jgi:hypothetical protein